MRDKIRPCPCERELRLAKKGVFAYIIPAYNEEATIPGLMHELIPFLQDRPGSLVVIADNASTDRTTEVVGKYAQRHPDLVFLEKVPIKGQGVAFAAAMQRLEAMRLPAETWVLFTAADLPFYFADALAVEELNGDYDLVIGSKPHPLSQVRRSGLRTLMTFSFRWIRRLLLGMRAEDPQGTLLFHPRSLGMFKECRATNYFFSTELVYAFEKEKARVLEVPIILRPELRPSKINVLRDSVQILKQTWDLAQSRGRIRGGLKPQQSQALPQKYAENQGNKL